MVFYPQCFQFFAQFNNDMPFDALFQIGMSDDYPSSHYVFEAQGHQISIADERLGEALSQIESAGRNLLLLAYFLDLKSSS